MMGNVIKCFSCAHKNDYDPKFGYYGCKLSGQECKGYSMFEPKVKPQPQTNADRIRALPTTEIVRCRDCMYSPSGTDDGENKGYGLEWPHDDWPEENPCPCKCEDCRYSHKPKPDFFCANGMAAGAAEGERIAY